MLRTPSTRGRRASPDHANDREHFLDRTMCPVCGADLEFGPGYLRCTVPSHYTRSVMSEDTIGEDLRDEHGVAWGRLGSDRHSHANPSYATKFDP